MLGVGHEHPYVAYSEWQGADYDIFLFDLRTQTESRSAPRPENKKGLKLPMVGSSGRTTDTTPRRITWR